MLAKGAKSPGLMYSSSDSRRAAGKSRSVKVVKPKGADAERLDVKIDVQVKHFRVSAVGFSRAWLERGPIS